MRVVLRDSPFVLVCIILGAHDSLRLKCALSQLSMILSVQGTHYSPFWVREIISLTRMCVVPVCAILSLLGAGHPW